MTIYQCHVHPYHGQTHYFWFLDPSIVPGAPDGFYIERIHTITFKWERETWVATKRKWSPYYLNDGFKEIAQFKTINDAMRALVAVSRKKRNHNAPSM